VAPEREATEGGLEFVEEPSHRHRQNTQTNIDHLPKLKDQIAELSEKTITKQLIPEEGFLTTDRGKQEPIAGRDITSTGPDLSTTEPTKLTTLTVNI